MVLFRARDLDAPAKKRARCFDWQRPGIREAYELSVVSLVASGVAVALVAHCAFLLADPGAPAEPLLSGACLGRVVMAIPRPLAWTRIYSLHRGALREERVVRVGLVLPRSTLALRVFVARQRRDLSP